MHVLSWFEIPTVELGRAVTFYRQTLGASFVLSDMGGMEMAVFEKGGPEFIGGALVRDPRRAPSTSGPLIYIQADHAPGGLDGVLARVVAAGGQVTLPKTSIGEHGAIGLVIDSEGNLIGLHTDEKA